MKNFSPAYAAHIRQPVTTLAICWQVVKNNGSVILGTTHDRNISITQQNVGIDVGPSFLDLTGTYLASSGISPSDIVSSSDMSVDNMEVTGAVQQPNLFIDVSVQDIESGILDSAQVTTFRLNWQDPDDFQEVMRHGFLGDIPRTSEGRYQTEVRGLTQVLQQTIGRTCGDRCDVKVFGDARCKFPVEALRVTGTIIEVISRKEFRVVVNTDSSTPAVGLAELSDATAYPIGVGDAFSGIPGCNRLYETCRDVYSNLINFRGPAIFCPGMDTIIAAPNQGQGDREAVLRWFEEKSEGEITSKKEFIQAVKDAAESGGAIPPPPVPEPAFAIYDGGRLDFTSGENAGFAFHVKHLTFDAS